MRAVWSFWSKPFDAHRQRVWSSDKHHLLSWVLSTETARRHYGRLVLITDSAGARMLVDGIGLAFDEVHTTLDAIAGADPGWPVFAQNAEPFVPGQSFYQPEAVESALSVAPQGWLPSEWLWYRHYGADSRGECCGVLGGTHVDFIRHYAAQAIRMIDEPGNQHALEALTNKQVHTCLLEQYLLAACIEYHRAHAGSKRLGGNIARVSIKYTDWIQPVPQNDLFPLPR